MLEIDKHLLGITAEYAVAAELGKRNIHALLTLGNQKKVDLLIFNDKKMLKIEVKGKNSRSWANLKNLPDDNTLFVFVDYYKKEENETPDFFIVSRQDWASLISQLYGEGIKKNILELDEDGTPNWPKQHYKGAEFTTDNLKKYKDCWDKIKFMLS